MKKPVFILLLILLGYNIYGQVSICSWNLKDIGKAKNNQELDFIAETIKQFDIIAIQEVVAGIGGPDAVSRLTDILSRKGFKWEYSISDPTISSSYKTERYAFLWKPSVVKKIGKAWLENKYRVEIDREPYYATFSKDNKQFTLVNFHAITKSKQPETEVKYFKLLPAQYPDLNLIFCGDFNLPESHTVFNPLKQMGFSPALIKQKTSLKQKCKGSECLASEFDNVFYHKQKVKFAKSGVIHFYKSFSTLADARMISDHVPIYFQFSLN